MRFRNRKLCKITSNVLNKRFLKVAKFILGMLLEFILLAGIGMSRLLRIVSWTSLL